MEIFLFWIAGAVIAAVLANNKGRSGLGFFLLSIVLSPVIGILAAAVSAPSETTEGKQLREGYKSRTYRLCPECAEVVRREAIKCKHCGASLPRTT